MMTRPRSQVLIYLDLLEATMGAILIVNTGIVRTQLAGKQNADGVTRKVISNEYLLDCANYVLGGKNSTEGLKMSLSNFIEQLRPPLENFENEVETMSLRIDLEKQQNEKRQKVA